MSCVTSFSQNPLLLTNDMHVWTAAQTERIRGSGAKVTRIPWIPCCVYINTGGPVCPLRQRLWLTDNFSSYIFFSFFFLPLHSLCSDLLRVSETDVKQQCSEFQGREGECADVAVTAFLCCSLAVEQQLKETQEQEHLQPVLLLLPQLQCGPATSEQQDVFASSTCRREQWLP